MGKEVKRLITRRLQLVLLIYVSMISLTGSGQEAPSRQSIKNIGLIIGNVVDASTGKAVPYATVSAMMIGDTIPKNIQSADKDGAFELDKLPLGYYGLIVKATGFSLYKLDSIYLRTERSDFNLGDVKIKPSSSMLDEVVVYAEKPLLENKDGKIIYNVGESALSNGASTSEILKNMPLVSNDPNGKILLKGKEPKILIDDKPTDLTADQLKDLLESLPGSSVEKIELMTNPPPQYATEQGGVINIVTRKGKIGMTGKSTISGGTRGEGSFVTNIGYRSKNFSTNNVGNVSVNGLKGYSYSNRQNFYKWGTNYNNTFTEWNNRNTRPGLRSQVSYEINKRNILDFVYQGNLNYFNNLSATRFSNLDSSKKITKLSTRENGSNGNGYSHSATMSYTWKGNNPLEVIRASINLSTGKNENGKDYYQQFLNNALLPTSDSTQSQYFNSYNRGFNARLNYDLPISHVVTFTTGATFQSTVNHNTLNTGFFSKQDSGFLIKDNLSNDFYFYQNIATMRAGATWTVAQGFRVIGGLQAENTLFRFDFAKGNGQNSKNGYWNLMPNFTVRKEFGKEFNTAIVYRASIRRPGLGELNPNIDYSDNNNLKMGNVELAPSTADNFDFNCNWMYGRFYLNTSLGFNKVKNVFYQIRTLLDSGKTMATYQNIATRLEYEASCWGGYTFTKKFRANGSIGYTFNRYSDAEKILFRYQDGGSYYMSLNYSYLPTNLLTLEGNAKYSSFADPQGKSNSNLNLNFGVQRKLMNKRLIVGLNIIDPIMMQQFTTYTYGKNFTTESFNSSNTRNYRLTVSYQLNKMVKKSRLSDKDKKTALDKASRKREVVH